MDSGEPGRSLPAGARSRIIPFAPDLGCDPVQIVCTMSEAIVSHSVRPRGRGPRGQLAADVWKKDVWNFQALSQTFFELRFSLGNEGKDGKRLGPPDLAWKSQTSFSQTSATTREQALSAWQYCGQALPLHWESCGEFCNAEAEGRFRKRLPLDKHQPSRQWAGCSFCRDPPL